MSANVINPALNAFLNRHNNLNGLPENTSRIVQMANDPDCNIFQLLKLISHDAGLVSKIIQAVNSSYYSLPNKITQLDRAVAYLGLRTVKDLTLAASISSLFKGIKLGKYTARDLWDHSIGVALFSRDLAVRSKKHDAEEAFLAGILHDIGLLMVVQSEEKQAQQIFAMVEKNEKTFAQAEVEVLGFNHAEAGAAVAERWKFPSSILEVIRSHHQPQQADEAHRPLCALITIADIFCCRSKIGYPLTCEGQTITDELLQLAKISPDAAKASEESMPRLLALASPLAA